MISIYFNYNFSGESLPTIVELAKSSPDLSTLVTALGAAALVDTLKGEGPFTVFAPNNAAFAKIPANELAELLKPENSKRLKNVLLTHVVPGKFESASIPKGTTYLQTAAFGGAARIPVSKGKGNQISIDTHDDGESVVIKADLLASNGVVHIVDTVIFPR